MVKGREGNKLRKRRNERWKMRNNRMNQENIVLARNVQTVTVLFFSVA
jgi:hypothetical protein